MSTINVNAIDKESGSNVSIGGSGTTVNIGASGQTTNVTGKLDASNADFVPKNSLSNRNLIINGAMNVAQRGTSSTSSGYGTEDRFRISFSGVAVTRTQETLSSGDPYDLGFRKFVRLTNTSVSSATDTFLQYFQKIEGQNIAASGWNYLSSSSNITLSFWVRSSLAGTYSAFVRSNDGTIKLNSFEFTLSANTWTKITKTFSGDASIQIDNDNGSGFSVFIVPYYGTDFTTSGHTNDVWQTYSGTDISSDFAQNWCNTTNATFDLTGIQLEVGSVATPFEYESYGQTLQKCLRYFYRMNGGTIQDQVTGAQQSGNSFITTNFPVEMRAVPTLSDSNISQSYLLYGGTTFGYFTTHSSLQFSSTKNFTTYAAASFSNGAALFGRLFATGSYRQFDAEL
jgi:hypothetical protein